MFLSEISIFSRNQIKIGLDERHALNFTPKFYFDIGKHISPVSPQRQSLLLKISCFSESGSSIERIGL